MAVTMYEAAVPAFRQGLNSCAALLDKAKAFSQEDGSDPHELLSLRLAPDMFPLLRQVQILADHAKGATARLAQVQVPVYPDTEQSFDELNDRLSRTTDFILGIDSASMDGAEDRTVLLEIGRYSMTFGGRDYLFAWALPNFHFHLTATYLILRNRGLKLGKRDFLGGSDAARSPEQVAGT